MTRAVAAREVISNRVPQTLPKSSIPIRDAALFFGLNETREMNVNFKSLIRAKVILSVLSRGNLVDCRNEGTPAPTVESLTKKRDDAQAELDLLMEDIESRGEVQTDEETTEIQNLLKTLELSDQQLQFANIREARNTAGNVKVNRLGFTGSAIGRDGVSSTGDGALIETDGNGEVNVDAWKNEADLGYENHSEFLTDVINAANNKPMSRQLEHLASLPNGEGYGGAEKGFRVPKAFINSCDDGCHMPGDAGLEAVRRKTQVLPMRMPTDESDPLAAVLTPMPIPMGSRSVYVPYLVSRDQRDGVYGGIEVTDMADGDCYERLSKMRFGGLQMQAKETYTLACFHKQTIEESMVSIEALFRNGSTIAQQRYKLRSLLRGSTTGHYQGVLDPKKNKALITIGRKNPGKCTVTHQDILNMKRHSWGYGGSFWGMSSEMESQLINMSIGLASTGNATIFTVNSVTGQGQLYGRPIVISDEFFGCCELCLINPSQIYFGQYQTSQFGRNPWLMWLCNRDLFRITEIQAARPSWECPMIQSACPIPKSPHICLGDEDHFPECDSIQGGPYRIKCDPCSGGGGCSDSGSTKTKAKAPAPAKASKAKAKAADEPSQADKS